MSADILIRCAGAARTFGTGVAATVALQPTTCEVATGARIALVGPSGSGKSTLLHLLAGLDEPTVGEITWPGIGDREALRPGPVAVIFQGPSLLPPLTVRENVALPLVLAGRTEHEANHSASGALEMLGLADLADKLPEEVSGGQAQRAAVARAIAGEPVLIVADEPTGQLDHTSAHDVVEALLAAADLGGATLLVSTHAAEVAERLTEQWRLHDGRLTIPDRTATW